MKTLEELYKDILASEELKLQCAEAIKAQKLEDFLKAHECEATMEEVKAFLESKKEVSMDKLDAVAGGCNVAEAISSVFSFGTVCAIIALVSAVEGKDEKPAIGEGGILC